MAGQKLSKTARASSPKTGRSHAFERAADATRVVPCANGTWAYVYGADGHTIHTPVGSEAFNTALSAVVATTNESSLARLQADITAIDTRFPGAGWDAALQLAQPEAVSA